MGSFGPQAYCTDHLDINTSGAIGNRSRSWHDLRKLNDQHAASTCHTMFDTFHGGCGGSVAAIQAGISVQAGSDSEAEEVQQFESLTGRISLGDVRLVQPERLPYCHIWVSCSSCKNFANLGDKKGNEGIKGGNRFEAQITLTATTKAKVVILENVDGVATIEGGVALANLIANATTLGYTNLYHRRITFAQYGDPENRSRRMIVAFHKSVSLFEPWNWQVSNISSWSLDHDKRKCAGKNLKVLHTYQNPFGTIDHGQQEEELGNLLTPYEYPQLVTKI
jgi:site-specific DNA-cytosine methylase